MDEERIREDLSTAIMLSKVVLSLVVIMLLTFFSKNIWQFVAIVLLVPPFVFLVFNRRQK